MAQLLQVISYGRQEHRIVNTIAADKLGKQGVRESAAMLLAWFVWNNLVLAPDGLSVNIRQYAAKLCPASCNMMPKSYK